MCHNFFFCHHFFSLAGRQAILLAPTGVLAEQHYVKLLQLLEGLSSNSLQRLLSPGLVQASPTQASPKTSKKGARAPVPGLLNAAKAVILLTSATDKAERARALEAIADGSARLLVGRPPIFQLTITR